MIAAPFLASDCMVRKMRLRASTSAPTVGSSIKITLGSCMIAIPECILLFCPPDR